VLLERDNALVRCRGPIQLVEMQSMAMRLPNVKGVH
jgi:hypothetical protein